MFVGVDVSGSFLKGRYYDDSLQFLAHYLYSHLNGLGGLDVPETLFVAPIGGFRADEPKTFFPKQTFEGKSVEEIEAKLRELFPRNAVNPYTEFNAFFEQVADTARSKNLILRPITVVMVSDGIPEPGGGSKTPAYDKIVLHPLENLARNVTVRLLYTDAAVGKSWQTQVKRRRVKVWTQDAAVMVYWKDPAVLLPGQPLDQQTKFFNWLKDNVDFAVRAKRVG